MVKDWDNPRPPAKAKKKALPEPKVELFFDVEQRSPEWDELRRGVPTASWFSVVLARGTDGGPSVERARYMRRLAGEILTGEKAEETFRSKAMERGSNMESDARAHYERTRLVDLQQIGFARRKLPSGRFVGCSPDSLIGAMKVLEIKTMMPELLIELMKKGARGFPSEHRAQCQGALWLLDRDEIDLMMFYRGMPMAPTFTLERNDVYIKELSEQVEVFDWELNKMVQEMKAMGGQS